MRVFLVFLFCWMPVFAKADTVGDPESGARLFGLHCAACHGPGARGDGPLSDGMTPAPPDLTLLAKQNHGALPLTGIATRIDSRNSQNSQHGGMPVYGWFFDGPVVTISSGTAGDFETTQPIADLLAWLGTVQD
ncbi:cytochrome c [uncultured Roseobacter sp.]|uniref:c-type cytochrome n=1 Tax=uncultured Roseobacter sp. TaxID=114847 RepID=UPI00263994F7|nr:cytochrome c [uncultured Roseobacter sp.]